MKKDEKQIKYSSIEEAIRACILRSGKTEKEVAYYLWPSNPRAHSKLLEALNVKKAQNLTVEDIIKISNFCGGKEAVDYINRKTFHKPAEKITEEQYYQNGMNRIETLLEEVFRQVDDIKRMKEEKDQLEKLRQGNVVNLDIKQTANK